MRQLNKTESIIYAIGGLLMAVGTGLYAFFIIQDVACIIMLIGAICFATMQMRQQYLGTNLTIRRLRKIMVLADIGFILAGLFMVEDSYGFVKQYLANSIGGYTTYVNIFYHNWVVILLIATALEIYTIHRIDYLIGKEKQS
ncbi:hypothetical protein BWX39_09245 [Prevotella intermedia ATCC 25611 = DSM 20706]|jgi:hypothetical protein|uniref:Uncharacterized protein n=1 Tax=Prevotella intermedia TaxID=28131 RepID=A0A2M8M367_PREIN|nr:hypothetical protein [Prevotella intermedia]APW32907.1 hypothetical protein BWX39_09245 [Prevotella intermedia ATCC 25611 = DSM 20706]PJE98635.1 hypothetical protein CUB97_09525 [Prevotella intermedia]SUB97952.1 Uncharacterised protein [Prevotella intermedia]